MTPIDRVLRPIVVVLVAIFWSVALAGAAWAFPCSAPKSAAKMNLDLQLGEPQYVYDLDTAGIRDIVSDRRGYVAGPWHLPLGLTVADLGMGFETDLLIRKPQGAGYCVALTEAKVTIGYADLTVYISSNYPEGSCEFDAILVHEQHHLQINQDVLEAYRAKFRKVLGQARRGKRVIFVHRKSGARAAYIQHLKHGLMPIVAEMQAILARRNAAIDTEESYRSVLAQCDGWLDGDLETPGSETGSRQTGRDDPVEPSRALPDSGLKIIRAPSADPE